MCSSVIPCLICVTFADSLASSSRVVTVPGLGKLRSNLLHVKGGTADAVVESLNIPFAVPPLGQLRFRPATPPLPWSGIRDATTYGPGCMQASTSYPVDEDCLQLNIWAPSNKVSKNNETEDNGLLFDSPLPVFVWAFGGGLTSGSGRTFNGTNLSMSENIIVVSVNYRLGALGFFASAELKKEGPATGGLNGVNDILTALQFVKKHISAFGGDANRVTLGGESSGSASSCILAFSPLAKGYFQRLIMESGVCTGPWMGPSNQSFSYQVSADFMADLNVSTLHELRNVAATDMVNANHWDKPNFGIDGFVLADTPANSEIQVVVGGEILLGGNTQDTTCLTATDPSPPESMGDLRALLAEYFGEDVDEVLEPYLQRFRSRPDTSSTMNASSIWLQMSVDAGVSCPSLWFAQRATEKHNISTYLYRFGFNATSSLGNVDHGGEVNFVWNRNISIFNSNSKAEGVSHAVEKYWSNFIAHGDPLLSISNVQHNRNNNNNNAVEKGDAHWPRWPRFEMETLDYLSFNANGSATIEKNYNNAICDKWLAYTDKGTLQLGRFNHFGYLC